MAVDKITPRDISTSVKIMAFVIPIICTIGGVLVSYSFSGGQVVNHVDSNSQNIKALQEDYKDSIKFREQSSIDIAVMKNQIQNLTREFDTFKTQYSKDIQDLKGLIKETKKP